MQSWFESFERLIPLLTVLLEAISLLKRNLSKWDLVWCHSKVLIIHRSWSTTTSLVYLWSHFLSSHAVQSFWCPVLSHRFAFSRGTYETPLLTSSVLIIIIGRYWPWRVEGGGGVTDQQTGLLGRKKQNTNIFLTHYLYLFIYLQFSLIVFIFFGYLVIVFIHWFYYFIHLYLFLILYILVFSYWFIIFIYFVIIYLYLLIYYFYSLFIYFIFCIQYFIYFFIRWFFFFLANCTLAPTFWKVICVLSQTIRLGLWTDSELYKRRRYLHITRPRFAPEHCLEEE